MTREYTRKDRDLIISDAAELAEQCELYPHTAMGSDVNFKSTDHPMYLHLSKVHSVKDGVSPKFRMFLRTSGGTSIMRVMPENNEIELIRKKGIGTITVKYDSTEEECFQESLVNPEWIDYDLLLKIRKITEYGIANYEEPE